MTLSATQKNTITIKTGYELSTNQRKEQYTKYNKLGKRMGKYKDGNVRPEDAARELNMSVDNLRQCMINRDIDIGVVKRGRVHNAYYINRKQLDELKRKWGL